MDDLISRQAAIEAVAKGLKGVFVEYMDIAEKMIGKLPSVEPEQKTAKWIPDKYGNICCSECRWGAPKIMTGCLVDRHLEYTKSEFCWHCGARMEESELR